MADSTTSVTIQLNADKGSAEETKRLLQSVKGVVVDLGKGDALKPLASATALVSSQFSEADKRALSFANRMVVIRESAEDLGRTYDDLIEREKRLSLAGQKGPAPKGTKAFDSVGASGDIASATGGLRGAFDALGIASDTTAGRMLELSEAMGDVGEFAPRLVTTLSDLASKGGPATTMVFDTLSSKIGETGAKGLIAAGSIGVAAGALAILSVAVQKLQADAQAAQKGISEAFSARDKTNTLRDSGTTESQARARAEQTARELATAREEERIARAAKEQAFKELQASNGDAKARFAEATGFFDSFNKRIEETSKRVLSLTADYADLNGAIGKGEFAKDAIAAADALSDGSKAMASTAAVQVTAADKQKDAALAQANAAQQALESARKAAEASLKFAQDAQKIDASARDNAADARAKARDAAASIGRDFWDDIGALSREAQADANASIASALIDEREAYIAHRDALADLTRDALKNEASSLKERNFLQAVTVSESLTDAAAAEQEKALREAQARQRAFEDEARQRDVNLDLERRERQIAADIARRELTIDLQGELQQVQVGKGRQLEALRMAYDGELQMLGGYLDTRGQMMAASYKSDLSGAAMRIPARSSSEVPLRSGPSSFSFGGMQPIGQSVTNNTPTIIINGAQDVQAVKREVLTVLREVGHR